MKTFIFDLDGTLINSLGDLTDSLNYALSTIHVQPLAEEDVQEMVGNGVGKLVSRALSKREVTTDESAILACFKQHYMNHCTHRTFAYDGMRETLTELKQRGCQLAVLSNKFQPAVSAICAKLFPNLFDLALGESPEIPKKPAPDGVLYAMEKLHAVPTETLYVGDSDVDILTGANAGIEVVSVAWGFKSKSFLLQHGATRLIDHPTALLDFAE